MPKNIVLYLKRNILFIHNAGSNKQNHEDSELGNVLYFLDLGLSIKFILMLAHLPLLYDYAIPNLLLFSFSFSVTRLPISLGL